jgi:LPXTG-motif cell wall-anchored protein
MIKKTIRLALFTSMLLLSVAPAMASTVEIIGNGADSDNTANVSVNKTINIYQTNTAIVQNSVIVNPNTGDNTANRNTGGDTGISTGDASAAVAANNTLNKNLVSINCCTADQFVAKIAGNGADSENSVKLNLVNELNITDSKQLSIKNNFKVNPNTGDNKADKNTGGDSWIRTGDASASISIDNTGNFNRIVIGSPIPGVTPLPNPPVTSTTSAPNANPIATVLAAVKQLPNTGFDYSFVLAVALGLVGSGLLLRSKSQSLDKFLRDFSH